MPRNVDAEVDASSRRVLLLTASYPPRTEVGAARWEGFTPFLVNAGWGVDVVIEAPSDAVAQDWERLARLPSDVRVLGTAHRRPWWHQAIIRARAPFKRNGSGSDGHAESYSYVAASPTLRTGLREAVGAAVHSWQSRQGVVDLTQVAGALADERHRVVISSGPPHFTHVAAAQVARRHRIPHVIDLRDPWALPNTASRLERMLPDMQLTQHEAPTLASAALIITNTAAAERVLIDRFPELRDRIRCMPNGSDVEPVSGDVLTRPARFQIAHCGSLYLDRDPRPFLRAVGRVRAQLGLGPDDLKVVFMGAPARVAGRSLTELAAEAGLDGLFEERAAGTRDEARQLLRESTMAVAFQGETRTQVPAKVFEYVAFPVWLLALVGSESATADMVANSDAIVLDIDDEAGTAQAIESCYRQFRNSIVPRPVGYDGRFSRARQADRLLAELNQLQR
jgi:hypothetical protein